MRLLLFGFIYGFVLSAAAQDTFQPLDVYDLEYVTNPQISPDGKSIIYARSFNDIMTDRRLSNLWMIGTDGKHHRPMTSGNESHQSPRWSPDGSKIVYVSDGSGQAQVHMLWLDYGKSSSITNLKNSPSNIRWSPGGEWLLFNMNVKKETKNGSQRPTKPDGAQWAPEPTYVDRLVYRSDGGGFQDESYSHLFLLPAEGGTARQITTGDFNHSSAVWAPDGKTIYYSSNQRADRDLNPFDNEVYAHPIESPMPKALTSRYGPDYAPTISPDGQTIAYLGYDDQKLGHQTERLYLMSIDGSSSRCISEDLDISFYNLQWAEDSRGLYFQYDLEGNTKVGYISGSGQMKSLAHNLGGSSIGRPYDGGDYHVHQGWMAFTQSTPSQPAELAVISPSLSTAKTITSVNKDLLAHKKLGQVEEIWYKSDYDGQRIQGWIMTPPDFDSTQVYPLILEIHGGPFANYGDRFSAELQLYASEGYVVLYTNPRGSTSYGEDFANLIHHNYPGNDYDDLMSGVDAVIAKGYIDVDRLFITGGSGGGVLTSWSIGKTHRFAAAVVAKPVINWYSWALTADIPGVVDYWFPMKPWEDPAHYMKRSPISLVGNVETPTMLLTGEQDYRTPISESEQYYQALKMRQIPASLVRIQESGHGIANKPSNLLAKVGYITAWFQEHDIKKDAKP